MSIDALLGLLERDASAEAARLVAEAERRARELLQRAETEAQRSLAEALARLEEEGRHVVACETAAAARRFREVRLRERAVLLQRIFAEAERELRVAGIERYREQLPALIASTFRFLEGGPAVLHCRPEVAAHVERWRGDRAGVEIRPDAGAAPGILGESADGAVVVDNTLPALLRHQEADLAVAVAARLKEE